MLVNYTATIANGESVSNAVDLFRGSNVPSYDPTLCGVLFPAEWTTASATFLVSVNGTDYVDLRREDGAEFTITLSNYTPRFVCLLVNDFQGIRYIKIRSGTSASPVAQQAERALILVARLV